MKTFTVYRTTKSEVCDYTTIEAETLEQAIELAERDEDEQSIDWKENYDEHDGWNYTAEELTPLN